MSLNIEKSEFGVTHDGQVVDRYRLSNGLGGYVDVITYGGCVTGWVCADECGDFDDIILGYDTLADYESCSICMGGIPGRFANRIARGHFEIDGQSFSLERNNNGHHLHGGTAGFHKRVWQGRIDDQINPAVLLTLQSAHGDAGYPGNVEVSVRYSLSDDNALTIDYRASTDRATIINLTNHSYFNLRGHQFACEDGAVEHLLQLQAGNVLEVNDECIPSGRLSPVRGSEFDFLERKSIGFSSDSAIAGKLYDHCYALDSASDAATLFDPESGRCLQTSTTLPGLQLYSALHVNNCRGKEGVIYGRRGSVCLEAQQFPDAPNQRGFPSAVLRPGQEWGHQTSYKVTTSRKK